MKLHIYTRLTKYLMIVGLSIFTITIALGIILIKQSSSSLLSSIQSRMLDVSNTAASILNGDVIEKIKSGDTETKEYQETYNILKLFQNSIKLKYIYCIKDMGNKKFVFLIDPAEDDPGEFGSPVVTTEELIKASQGNPAVNNIPYDDNWGSFYSAYSPVFNSSGDVVAIVAVDFSAEWYEQQISNYIKIVVIAAILALCTICILAFTITKISRGRYSTIFRLLHQINDEINRLLEVIDHLTTPQSKRKEITKLQDNIINNVYDIKGLRGLIKSIYRSIHDKVDSVVSYSYVDGLTFLNNQAAYIKNKKKLDKNIKNGISFIIVVFDICDIKKINENYGDDTGNMAILDAANLMKSVFCPDNIYRYNNNQFVGIFYNISEDDLKILFSKFEEKIDLLNQTPNLYKVPLVISKGYAIYNANIDNDCNDTFNRAKIEMYNDKKNYYKNFKGLCD